MDSFCAGKAPTKMETHWTAKSRRNWQKSDLVSDDDNDLRSRASTRDASQLAEAMDELNVDVHDAQVKPPLKSPLGSQPSLCRVLERIDELGASPSAASLLNQARRAMDETASDTFEDVCLDSSSPLIASSASKSTADEAQPLPPCSSNACTAFVIFDGSVVVASSNACRAFLMLGIDGTVLASSNPCTAFIIVDSAGVVVASTNPCTAFVCGVCAPLHEPSLNTKDESIAEATAGSDVGVDIVFVKRAIRDKAVHVSFDPFTRFTALAKTFRVPRGFKSTEHLDALRASCPTLGSLSPRKDHPGRHEVTYDPMARYTELARWCRPSRGHKDVEHLRNLRSSTKGRASDDLQPRTHRMPSNGARSTDDAACSVAVDRHVRFDEDNLRANETALSNRAQGPRPPPLNIASAKRRAKMRVNAKKSPRLSPRLSPRQSPKLKQSLKSPAMSPGLRSATAAILFEDLALPSSYVRQAKRQELEHMAKLAVPCTRAARHTAMALRVPKLFHRRGTRGQ
jgi:hypothetical protein